MYKLEERQDKYDDAEAELVLQIERVYGKRCPYTHLALAIIVQAARDRDNDFLTTKNKALKTLCKLAQIQIKPLLSYLGRITKC